MVEALSEIVRRIPRVGFEAVKVVWAIPPDVLEFVVAMVPAVSVAVDVDVLAGRPVFTAR